MLRHLRHLPNASSAKPDLDSRPKASRNFNHGFAAAIFALLLAFPATASAQMVMDVDHEVKAAKSQPQQQYDVKQCGDESLPAGDYNFDLHVTGTCVADGTLGNGIYKYHWVYIHDGGTLMFQDKKLDLYANSILVLNGGTLQAGTPDANGAIGANGGQVTLHLWGSKDAAAIPCEKSDGSQDETCGIPSQVWNNANEMKQIYPSSCNPNPLDPRRDCFYKYDDPNVSIYYFGRKTLAVSYGGTLRLFGKKGSTFDGLNPPPSDTGASWRRLITDVKKDSTSFDIDAVVDWKAGDHIVVTPTDYLPGHAEEAIVSNVEPHGKSTTITISGVVLDDGTVQDGGLRFPHSGTKFQIPSDIKTKLELDRSDIETRAAVALLSRDIRVVSEGDMPPDTSKGTEPDFPPTLNNYFGGHVIFRQGFKQVEMQGVEFRQLGQGGIIGRYAIHFHMTRKVPLDTFVKDCSINESMTRWITLHGIQGVLLARNVGWKSIGHGFYIEDGSETDNRIYANIGILARAGVRDSQNPRQAPGILAHPDITDYRDPYATDWLRPSVFWIMNGWNDFEYNMASGAGSCGMCYWLPAGANSGPSRYEYWTGYASRQRGLSNNPGLREFNSGTSPLQTFVGNACSTAMFSFIDIGQISSECNGFGPNTPTTVAAIPGAGPDIPREGLPPNKVFDYFPIVTGLRIPTKCNVLDGDCGTNQSPKTVKCNGTNDTDEANCMPTVLDHYTTSFNFSQKNFSAIWLRPWWRLVTDSSITDQLGPGLTFVTGGGYTRSDSALGNWDVGLRNVFVGQTQSDPPDQKATFFASDLGPFTPNGITKCDNTPEAGYCLSKDNGISIPITPFNAGQRMFNIYDGPSFQDASAYLNIKARLITDCTSKDRNKQDGVCVASKYMYGHSQGLLQGPLIDPGDPTKGRACYIPNAAIAWKQENGFYYPPAFFSRNLVFRNVDIRHFVIEPLFKLNTFETNLTDVAARYCTWKDKIFEPFNDIDRQTVLNDIDGSLTGLLADTMPKARETLSINEDPFFRVPTFTQECSSDRHEDSKNQKGPPATAITSPYEYVTTAIIADCGLRSDISQCGKGTDELPNWTYDCAHCYGVPLFRQYWTMADNAQCDADPDCKKGDPVHRPGRITMMGQSTGQRSALTTNHGWFYIDTTVPASQQKGLPLQNGRSVFLSGHTYYVYMIYGQPDTQMEYWMYVGAGADKTKVESEVGRYRVNVDSQIYKFKKKFDADPDFLSSVNYEPMDGWLKVKVNLSAYQTEFTNDRKNFCKPATYCSWDDKTKSCGCLAGSGCKDDSVCSWGPSDDDCPTKGCFGFSFKIQPQFDNAPKPGPPPPAAFPSDDYWKAKFKLVDEATSGPECHYTDQP